MEQDLSIYILLYIAKLLDIIYNEVNIVIANENMSQKVIECNIKG